MTFIEIGLTNACNQKCIFCIAEKFDPNKPWIVNRHKIGISTTEAKQRILKLQSVVFMGGEPTTRADLVELISFAKRQGKRVGINSNGVLFSNEEFCKKVVNAGLDYAMISLHSHKKQHSDKITRVKGNYEKTIKGIENLIKLGVEVEIVHVIYSENYRELIDFLKFLKKRFREIKRVSLVFIRPNKNPRKIGHLIPTLTEVRPYLTKAMEWCSKNIEDFSVQGIPLCFMTDYIKNNYHVRMSRKLFLEDIKRCDFGYKDQKCLFCSVNNICQGVVKEYAQLYGTDELFPIRGKFAARL
jgi:MoaA/NifB/PqqE/SkfB family radical SAM enzyme